MKRSKRERKEADAKESNNIMYLIINVIFIPSSYGIDE